jgi:hypothetical protein
MTDDKAGNDDKKTKTPSSGEHARKSEVVEGFLHSAFTTTPMSKIQLV